MTIPNTITNWASDLSHSSPTPIRSDAGEDYTERHTGGKCNRYPAEASRCQHAQGSSYYYRTGEGRNPAEQYRAEWD
jgi:hypothetical protein